MTHASTFSGIGGPEVAAAMLGWENLFHCEINQFGRKVLDYYFPNAESYEDITTTDFTKWRGRVDVLTGGFPCQPFSYAGKRKGSQDDRYLWPYMLRCIEQVRPTWFVGENVAGITTMVLPGEDVKVGCQGTLFGQVDFLERRERYVIEEICQQLEGVGYSVKPIIIPACAVGAPHRRDRVFFIANGYDSSNSKNVQRNVCIADECSRLQTFSELGDGCCQKCATEIQHNGLRQYGPKDERRNTEEEEQLSSNSECFGRNAWRHVSGESQSSQQSECGEFQLFRTDGAHSEGLLPPPNRWRAFPSVSPVHRGNDGLPFPVDDLTIPFSKWRKESIKAYGNAIVPQVIYEIFRAIELVENSNNVM